MLEFTRSWQSANRGRWGRGEPSVGSRNYELGVVEVIGVQMILNGLVSSVAGGGCVRWRVHLPGSAFEVIFLDIGATAIRRAPSATNRTRGPTIGARGQ
jgi:hypothetical protein